MVTNLPKEARAQWRRVSEAKDPKTKLEELRKFYSMIPKHKGTKNLLKQVRRQMARLREEIEERRRGGGTYLSNWNIYKHGIARIGLLYDDYKLGIKAFKILSNRDVDENIIWNFEPFYGVLSYEYIQFQLALLPPLNISESIDYKILNYVKSTVDYVFIIGNRENIDKLLDRLYSEGLYIGRSLGKIDIERTPIGGIRIIGGSNIDHKEVEDLLRSYRIYNAIIKIEGEVTISDIEDHILGIRTVKPGSAVIFNDFIEIYHVERNKISGDGLRLDPKEIVDDILANLRLIRVYTKPYKENIIRKPIIIKEGSRVIDLAKEIHSRLAKNFRYAVVVRGGKRIKTTENFILRDGDIVTIYI